MNTLYDKYTFKKGAFTLIEVMLLLVVLSLVFASSAAVITRKHKLRPKQSVHGTYICYRDNVTGELHEAMYSGKNTTKADTVVDECSFQTPSTATYLYLQLVGGGGAGGNANQPTDTVDDLGNLPSDGHIAGYLSGLDDRLPDYDANFPDGKNCSEITDDNSAYCTDSSGKPVPAALSLIRNMDASEDGYGVGVGDKQGLTLDYIHKFSWLDKTFSARSLFKLFKDNDVKYMVYDYSGRGSQGTKINYRYFTYSDEEKEYDNNYHWYKSYCYVGEPNELSAKQCAKLLEDLDSPRVTAPIFGSNTEYKFGGNTGVEFGVQYLEGNEYCQYRFPLYQNCPLLKSVYVPKYEEYTCEGQQAGAPGLFSSTFAPISLNTTYQLGKRFKYQEGSTHLVDKDMTIDYGSSSYIFRCIVWPESIADLVWPDKQNITPIKNINKGTFLTVKDSCTKNAAGKYVQPCKDSDGNVIMNPKNAADSSYLSDTASLPADAVIASASYGPEQESLGGISSRYFLKGKYPTADYDFRLYQGDLCQYTPSFNETGAGIQKIVGEYDGHDGGIPYFGDKPGEGDQGFRLCKNGSCAVYGINGSGNLVYDSNVISQSYKASKGGAPATGRADFINFSNFTRNENVEDPCLTNYTSTPEGTTNLKWTTPSNYKDFCSRNVAIRAKQSMADAFKLGTFGNHSAIEGSNAIDPFSFTCPFDTELYADTRDSIGADLEYKRLRLWPDLGLSLWHYTGTMDLYYGEKGYAGTYKSFFSRSFGSAKLLMNPGKGGIAYAGVNAQNVSEGNVRNDSNEYGRYGSSTIFGTDCTLKEGGESSNGDDYECALKIEAPGGSGGRSHLLDEQEMHLFNNEEIYNLVNKGDKTHVRRNTSNYTPDDLVNSPHNGELSGFQEISFLSDLSFLDNGDFLANLGRGGNGSYVEHKCYLRPQYFIYSPNGYTKADNISMSLVEMGAYILDNATDSSEYYSLDGDSSLPEWEGYVAITKAVINNACSDYETEVPAEKRPLAYASKPASTNKFVENEPTDGYPGAVVIMW